MSTRRDRVTLSVPAQTRYLQAVRLLTGGLGARANLSMEDVENVKIAVNEACTNVTKHAFCDENTPDECSMKLVFFLSDGEMTVEVIDEGSGFDPKHLQPQIRPPLSEQGSLGLYLVHELMDEVKIESAPGSGTKVIMTKRRSR